MTLTSLLGATCVKAILHAAVQDPGNQHVRYLYKHGLPDTKELVLNTPTDVLIWVKHRPTSSTLDPNRMLHVRTHRMT